MGVERRVEEVRNPAAGPRGRPHNSARVLTAAELGALNSLKC